MASRLRRIGLTDDVIAAQREEGTHEQLLRYGGHYEKLWRHQSGGFIANELDERDDERPALRPAVG